MQILSDYSAYEIRIDYSPLFPFVYSSFPMKFSAIGGLGRDPIMWSELRRSILLRKMYCNSSTQIMKKTVCNLRTGKSRNSNSMTFLILWTRSSIQTLSNRKSSPSSELPIYRGPIQGNNQMIILLCSVLFWICSQSLNENATLNLFNRVIPYGHILFCSNLFGDARHMNIDSDHFDAGNELFKPTMIKQISYSEIIMQTNREW